MNIRCDICNRRFEKVEHLNRHMGAKHQLATCPCGTLVKDDGEKCAECAAGEAEFQADCLEGR